MVLAALAADAGLPGAARYGVEIGDLPGVPAGIADVTHDPDGFLWVASEEGLFRFDGTEFVNLGGRVRLQQVAAGPDGLVVAHAFGGTLHELRDGGLKTVARNGGGILDGVQDVAFDGAGNLWVLVGSRALRRDRAGVWLEITPETGSPGRARLRSVAPRRAGGVFVGTFDGDVMVVNPPEPFVLLASGLGGIVQALVEDDSGRIVANVRGGARAGVLRLAGGHVDRIAAHEGRPTSLVLRRGRIWSSWDDGVVTARDDEPPERLGPPAGFHGGGSLHVDHEGTLWVTSFSGGLTRFPEPDTAIWTAAAALPHAAVRRVVSFDGQPRASAWGGPLRFDVESRRWLTVSSPRVRSFDLWFGSERTGLWAGGQVADPATGTWRGSLLRWGDGPVEPVGRTREASPWVKGAAGPNGRLYLAYGKDVLAIDPGGRVPRRVAELPPAIDAAFGFAVSSTGELAACGRRGPLCRLAPEVGAAWRCASVPELDGVMAAAFVDDRTLWIASETSGLVVSREGEASTVALDERELGSAAAVWIEPSPRGGFWVVGRVALVRLMPDARGARVVERITSARGLPRWWLSSVFEEAGGTLWISGLPGIARIPARVRETASPPLAVRVTSVAVAGASVPVGAPVRTVAGRHAVEVRWAALSYRDPSRIRHRFRSRPDDAWAETERSRVTFIVPAAGRYAIEVASSSDGVHWSAAGDPIDLRVDPPWYTRWPMWAAAAVLASGLAYLAHRLRLAHLVRLERQRTQIAMDLHDDLGATLGSIGLLAAVAGEERADAAARRSALERIAHDSREASSSLADIVWSLRPGSDTLDRLVLALRERAAELAPNGQIEIRFEAPEGVPRIPLSLSVRRNVQWIAVEAMRNAVRHATPTTIEVILAPSGGAWRLTVTDDGSGAAGRDASRARGGMGLENMQRRAAAIGGEVDVRRGTPRGTAVSVLFRPDGRRPHTIV
jgi:signal transduction histidine kinase